MDISKIIILLDNLLRQLNDLLNKLLKGSDKEPLSSNDTEFGEKDVLNPGEGR